MSRTMFVPDGEPLSGFNMDEKGMALMDTHEGIAQKNARTWQLIAICSLSFIFICLGLLLYAIQLPKTVPVIVSVNDVGEANYVGKISKELYGKSSIPEVHKEYVIKSLISNMFNICTDEVVQQKYMNSAADLVQRGAAGQLNVFYSDNNPYNVIGEYIQSVKVTSLLKESENTYIAMFTVTTTSVDGRRSSSANYSMLTTLDYFEISQKNPLGVYITNFSLKGVEQ